MLNMYIYYMMNITYIYVYICISFCFLLWHSFHWGCVPYPLALGPSLATWPLVFRLFFGLFCAWPTRIRDTRMAPKVAPKRGTGQVLRWQVALAEMESFKRGAFRPISYDKYHTYVIIYFMINIIYNYIYLKYDKY